MLSKKKAFRIATRSDVQFENTKYDGSHRHCQDGPTPSNVRLVIINIIYLDKLYVAQTLIPC